MYDFHKCINSCIKKRDLESLRLFVIALLAERVNSMMNYNDLVFCNVFKSDVVIAKTLAMDAQDIVYCLKTLKAIHEGNWEAIKNLFTKWYEYVIDKIVEEI